MEITITKIQEKGVDKLIEEWREQGGGGLPTLDVEAVRLHISKVMLSLRPNEMERRILDSAIMNYMNAKSIECKILEYDLKKACEELNKYKH